MSLAYGENKQNKNPYGYYHCSKNGQGLRQCSMHYIRYDVLYAYVLARLQYWSMLAQKDEDKLLKRLLNASDRERNSAKKKQAAELKKAEKRKAEVDGLFAKMYEDWSAGRISLFSSAKRLNLFSPIRKYFDASSMVRVYFSHTGISLLFIRYPLSHVSCHTG